MEKQDSNKQDAAKTRQHEDKAQGLYLQLFSIHGLIRANNLELGRDADTGGQTKYLIELAQALGEHPQVRQVDLFTRLIEDKRVSRDYSRPIEPISENVRIVRISCGGKQYKRKELLWPALDEFVDETLRFIRKENLSPDLVHGHYADAGYVAAELAGFLGVPLVFTGHSLGRNKRKVLESSGMSLEEINKQYFIEHRINVEEEVLRKADMVIASTHHEVERGYELYEGHKSTSFQVIPPGINVDKFYPYYDDDDDSHEVSETIKQAKAKMKAEINRFLNNPNKPFILAVSRPDRRKNISGLVAAYGQDKELQSIANLAIFAGVRKDIADMDDNEREVLTDLLLSMDKFDLYGKLALPKKHDPTTEIPVLYRLAAASGGVFVNPALVENFGITIIEASSTGLPVVSTDHGGPQDILTNCQSGILVDSSDTEQISQALKKVLIDGEMWREFSNNGVNGVRKHYSWYAHCDKYLERITPLLSQKGQSHKQASKPAIAPQLRRMKRLFVSDIDYTLLGDDPALEELSAILRDKHESLGFGLATGRSIESVKEMLETHTLPTPDIIISSVGSEIYYGADLRVDQGYAQHISYQWKPKKIYDALDKLPFLQRQEDIAQRGYKISYYMKDSPDNLAKVHAALSQAKLRCNVIYSHGQFLDILPHRASKGKAIRYLSYKWSLSSSKIAVAGDSGNDEEMLRGQFRGIVVGNYSPELEDLRKQKYVYFAEGHFAKGVKEGLEHYRFI